MRNYGTLKSRVDAFLKDNPDIDTITLRRKESAKRRVYSSSNDECYGRMPESCPRLREIIDKHLPAGVEVTSYVRNALFQSIHDDITSQFRQALTGVMEQKYSLITELRRHQINLRSMLEDAETEIPEPPAPTPASAFGTTVVEIEDEEETEF